MTVVATTAGELLLRPVEPADLPLLAAWMNDPAVAAFWELDGPAERTALHVRRELDAGNATNLGLLDGVPMSYWEVYPAERDRLAEHYPAEPGDTGLHLLLGPAPYRGRGLGAVLLAAVAEDLLRGAPRVVAEPDVRNTASIRAFQRAGFTAVREIDLPEKRAALMVRERARPQGTV
ncbi:GNAT family N-acetyltransferase [Kitasatospora mediocidica]|uniref:GNAT family N-acetyltransferase n=1 Tax=Kitasatospora mediocidica TaxID=58352 RepID=UPI00055EF5D5